LVDDAWIFEIRGSIAPRAALKRNDRQAGVGQRLRHDGAGPTVTDDDGVRAFFLRRLVDPVSKSGTRAGEADPFPGSHAAIASVEWIGEVAFVGVLQQLREE